jgi:hypothetical protein
MSDTGSFADPNCVEQLSDPAVLGEINLEERQCQVVSISANVLHNC